MPIIPFSNFASEKQVVIKILPMNKAAFLILAVMMMAIGIANAQETDKVFKDEKTGNDMLVGEVSRAGLTNIGTWFNEEYNLYNPDTTAINFLKAHRASLPNLFIVMGTWCGDSKEHVPHFYKIADLIDYPKEKIFVLGVDRDKKGGDFCLADFNITLVPTFIFTSKGEEIGRIIETPVISLEQDMVNIINGNK